MTLLALLRHAKAVKDDRGGDHARALSDVGRAAAMTAGEKLRRCLPSDVLVVASDARRTWQTAELAFPDQVASHLRLEPRLYAASLEGLLAFVQHLPSDATAVALVGHNPGISDLASTLAGAGDPDDLLRLSQGLATADAVVLDLPDGWAGARLHAGRVLSVLARKDGED